MHQRTCALRDIDGVIAHPLEIAVDLDRGGDKAQVSGHGLLQRQQARGQVIDLDLHAIYAHFIFHDLADLFLVLFHQRKDTAVDGRLNQTAHLKQLLPQLVELNFKMAQWATPPRLAEPAGNVIFGLFLRRILENDVCLVELDELPEQKKSRLVRHPRRLLHVVRNDYNRATPRESEQQFLNLCSRDA